MRRFPSLTPPLVNAGADRHLLAVPARLVALLVVLLVALVPRATRAQPAVQPAITQSGVAVAVPASLREAPSLAGYDDADGRLEHVFTDDAEKPLTLLVQNGGQHEFASLPSAAEEGASAWVRSFASELGIPGAYDFQPGRYDPERGAVSLRYRVKGPSPARLMVGVPDDHGLWVPVLRAGGDPSQTRCLLGWLLGGKPYVEEPQLRANQARASEECGLSPAEVEAYVDQVGVADFLPAISTIHCLAFFTRWDAVVTLVIAPLERARDVEAASELVWAHTEIPAEARLPVGESTAGAYGFGRLVGIVLGSLLAVFGLGGGIAWLLVRLGVRSSLAVGGCFGLLALLAVVGTLGTEVLSLHSIVQLSTYLLATGLGFRPLSRWLAQRAGPGPGATQKA